MWTKCVLFSFTLQVGILRYCGTVDFASGQWAGIELEGPLGKNDGTVAGRSYFRCLPLHGE